MNSETHISVQFLFVILAISCCKQIAWILLANSSIDQLSDCQHILDSLRILTSAISSYKGNELQCIECVILAIRCVKLLEFYSTREFVNFFLHYLMIFNGDLDSHFKQSVASRLKLLRKHFSFYLRGRQMSLRELNFLQRFRLPHLLQWIHFSNWVLPCAQVLLLSHKEILWLIQRQTLIGPYVYTDIGTIFEQNYEILRIHYTVWVVDKV